MKRQLPVFLCMAFVFASPVLSTIATTIGGLTLNAAATTALATGLAASGAVGLALGYTVGRGSRRVGKHFSKLYPGLHWQLVDDRFV